MALEQPPAVTRSLPCITVAIERMQPDQFPIAGHRVQPLALGVVLKSLFISTVI